MNEFERDYQKYHRELYSYLYGIYFTKQESQDTVQETFLAFLREQQQQPMAQEKKRPWLFRVAKNKALNNIRQKKNKGRLVGEAAVQELTPESMLMRSQQSQTIRAVMERLTERESTILRLFSHGFDYREMAEAMNIEKASVSKTLGRAKKAFKRKYQEITEGR